MIDTITNEELGILLHDPERLIDAAEELMQSISPEELMACTCAQGVKQGACLHAAILGAAISLSASFALAAAEEGKDKKATKYLKRTSALVARSLLVMRVLGRREAEPVPEVFDEEEAAPLELGEPGFVQYIRLEDVLDLGKSDEALAELIAAQVVAAVMPQLQAIRRKRGAG